MYRVLNQILDVKNFAVSNDEIIIRFRNGSIQFNNMDITSINSNFKNIHFIHLDKIYYWCTTRNGNFLLDKQFDVLKEYPSSSVYWDEIVLDSKDLKLYSSTIEFDKNGVVVYDLEIRNLRTDSSFIEIGKKKILGFNYQIVNKFVFSTNENNTMLHAYTLPTAQPLWQFDLGSLGEYTTQLNETKTYEVRKFLGVTENKLWVLLSNDELLVLDISTGEVINKINEIPAQKMNEYTCNRLGNCMVLDEKEGKIKGFVHFVYWELDAQTFEISTFNLKDTLAENQFFGIMNVLEFCQSDTHLFVPMKQIDENGSMWSFLIALNKETKQIDWKHQLPWTGNNTPQYANNKLYQLDNDNTLHIFEKENA